MVNAAIDALGVWSWSLAVSSAHCCWHCNVNGRRGLAAPLFSYIISKSENCGVIVQFCCSHCSGPGLFCGRFPFLVGTRLMNYAKRSCTTILRSLYYYETFFHQVFYNYISFGRYQYSGGYALALVIRKWSFQTRSMPCAI